MKRNKIIYFKENVKPSREIQILSLLSLNALVLDSSVMVLSMILFILWNWDFKEMNKRREEAKKKRISLTTDEMLKFKQLKHKGDFPFFELITVPIYGAFYSGLFVIVMRYAFNIELKIYALILITFLIKIWKLIFIIAVILYLVVEWLGRRMNRKLKEKIISERK